VNYWRVILATAVIFGAGVLTGGLLVDHVAHSHPKNPHRAQATSPARPATNAAAPAPQDFPMPRMAREMGKEFVQQLNEKLQLTPDQRLKIEKIIAAGQNQNHEIWTNVTPKLRAVMQEVNQQIRAELTPGQLAPFEDLVKRPVRRGSSTNAAPVLRPTTNALPPGAPQP
jgi:Spy/CpxP family protein refolding chaperone